MRPINAVSPTEERPPDRLPEKRTNVFLAGNLNSSDGGAEEQSSESDVLYSAPLTRLFAPPLLPRSVAPSRRVSEPSTSFFLQKLHFSNIIEVEDFSLCNKRGKNELAPRMKASSIMCMQRICLTTRGLFARFF